MSPETKKLFLTFERPMTFFVINDADEATETEDVLPGTYALEPCRARLGSDGASGDFFRIRGTRRAITPSFLRAYLGHGELVDGDDRKADFRDIKAVLEELDASQYLARVAELQLMASQAQLDVDVLAAYLPDDDGPEPIRAKLLETMNAFVRLAAYVPHGQPIGTFARRSAIFAALGLGRDDLLRPGGLVHDRFCQEPEMTPAIFAAMLHAIRKPRR